MTTTRIPATSRGRGDRPGPGRRRAVGQCRMAVSAVRSTTLLVPAVSVPALVRLLRQQPRIEHVSVVERVGGVVAFVCWSRGRPDHAAEQRLHDDLCTQLLAAGIHPLPLGVVGR